MTIAIIVLSVALCLSVALSIGLRREIQKYQEIKRKMLEEELYRAKVREFYAKNFEKTIDK